MGFVYSGKKKKKKKEKKEKKKEKKKKEKEKERSDPGRKIPPRLLFCVPGTGPEVPAVWIGVCGGRHWFSQD